MKKQFQILVVTFITVGFISCSKEKIETNETIQNEEIATTMNSQRGGNEGLGNLPISTKALEGWYFFNGNLKDASNKLAPAIPSTPGAELYTQDRMGVPGKAIRFTGRYSLEIPNVPTKSKMSVAAWMKFQYDTISTFHVVNGWAGQPTLGQQMDKYYGAISTPATTAVLSNPIDDKWHHLVATYDETNLKFYVDGVFIGSSFNPSSSWSSILSMYVANFPGMSDFWVGSLDDLVIYTRALTASEVQKLYNIYK